jgi:ribonucleotide reductase alpha subunit
LFFPNNVSGKWVSDVHIRAWELGIKTLYYVRTESVLAESMRAGTFSDCVYCEG